MGDSEQSAVRERASRVATCSGRPLLGATHAGVGLTVICASAQPRAIRQSLRFEPSLWIVAWSREALFSVTHADENMEKIYVGLFDPDPTCDEWVRFLDVREELGDREEPPGDRFLTFDQVKDELVQMFRRRNPKLRVQDMPSA